MLLKQLAAVCDCCITDNGADKADLLSADINDIVYDSREAAAGTLFFCLPGARFDGHSFAGAAYAAGCRAFVVEHHVDLPEDAIQIKVESARHALALMSAEFYGNPADSLVLIGITGTKGKTTTSILIRETLNNCGIKAAYIGGNGVIFGNTHLETVNTTPESRELQRYFRMMVDNGVTHVAMEVSSQALAYNRVDGIKFDIVVYTNLSPDHISPTEHKTFDEYRDAKKRLFTEFGAAHFVCNIDDENARYMLADSPIPDVVTYAIGRPADYVGCDAVPFREDAYLGIDFEVLHNGVKTGIRMNTPGEFSVYNGLAALAVCGICGINLRSCSDAMKNITVLGRFELVNALPDITFVIDYAHNGLSLRSALRVLREYNPGRLICVFGTIGGRAFDRRAELAEAASEYADLSIITSDNPDREEPEKIIADIVEHYDKSKLYTVIVDREEAVRFAVRIARAGDIVLFAGKGHENYQLIDGKKQPFSERSIILDEASKIPAESYAV